MAATFLRGIFFFFVVLVLLFGVVCENGGGRDLIYLIFNVSLSEKFVSPLVGGSPENGIDERERSGQVRQSPE